ncbi:GCN5 family acetyltransferase [Amycolatopsis orientalis]|uniref:GCN5 family acetyltransferase n=1 Tax=Amycolatopsis orientalis TaxID=31958 RepID=A0A193C3T9_AMYOR|nr:GNAT family N-acetyltransferase [Amycolatopsis orientalis]ANN19147.1 GCN5 family acetyltransferase [Amycolatopsis orientalis]
MTNTSELALRHHDADGMYQLRAPLLTVYTEVYADLLGDPFFTPERFWERLEAYAKWPGFALVTGWLRDELVGYTLGYRLPTRSAWWRGFRGDVDPQLLEEDGKRTFAVTQLMVLPGWRRRGYARQLHDALLRDRTEERATLLVKPDNIPARTTYLSWGWQRFGQLQPFDDAPVYESLMCEFSDRSHIIRL